MLIFETDMLVDNLERDAKPSVLAVLRVSAGSSPGCAETCLDQQRLKEGVPTGVAALALPMMRDHASRLVARHAWPRGQCAASGALIPARCPGVGMSDSGGQGSGPPGWRCSTQALCGSPGIVGESIHRGVLLAKLLVGRIALSVPRAL
jgi:hypothetical protein